MRTDAHCAQRRIGLLMRINLIALAEAVTHSLHIKSAADVTEVGTRQCCEERDLLSSAALSCLEPEPAEDRGHVRPFRRRRSIIRIGRHLIPKDEPIIRIGRGWNPEWTIAPKA
jgi:hypothetical protein